MSSPSLPWTRRLEASCAAGIALAAFSIGRGTAPHRTAPVLTDSAQSDTALSGLDPTEAAERVSKAFQLASADAARSVVQVRASRMSRRRNRWWTRQEGSGFIISEDGLVVTNEHVVKGCERFDVVFTDGSSAEAELMGTDDGVDLAVLKIKATEGRDAFDPMPLRTELPPVGELVLAVGNPLSLGHTVTLGVVNGLGRSDLDIADYENYIQTDAAINPGNSGGPLMDVRGRAIGITVAVGLESNNDGGLAFAIPAAMVQHVVDQVLEHGEVRRSRLGVRPYYEDRYQDPTAEARSEGYDGRSRIRVRSVTKGSPAAREGIRAGDIIVSIGDKALTDSASYRNVLIERDPGERVEVLLWRSGKRLTKSIVLAERP